MRSTAEDSLQGVVLQVWIKLKFPDYSDILMVKLF